LKTKQLELETTVHYLTAKDPMKSSPIPGIQRAPLAIILIFAILGPASALAQLTAHGAISLIARLPSSVTLSETMLPASITITNGKASATEATVQIKWNVNPRESSSLRIIATMVGTQLAANDLEVSTGHEFRPFPQGSQRIVLQHVKISPDSRQAEQQLTLQMRIRDDRLAVLSDGVYQGWIKLEAELL
jgi:hypothetical protein